MLSIFFIIDGPRLEAQAALLAASLIHHNGPRHLLIGYVPDRHRMALNPAFKDLMARCNVDLRRLPGSPSAWAKPYPHGNKILAACDRRDTAHSLFLDTDMICAAPLDLSDRLDAMSILVAPEGKPSWGHDLSRWQRVYQHFDLDLPDERVTLARGRRRQSLPYFNAGMIAFPEGPLAQGQSFGELWLDTALVIDHVVPVAQKRPWLDQISLPVTLKRFGLGYRLAEEALNFSISNRQIEGAEAPTLLHYHRFGHLASWSHFRQAALEQTRALAGQALYAKLTESYAPYWHCEPAQDEVAVIAAE